MTSLPQSYHGYRFPPDIIGHAVWLYHRFCLSFRDAEDLLAQRGITVSYETIRQWCRTFGPAYAKTLRRRRGRLGDTWYLDELFVVLNDGTIVFSGRKRIPRYRGFWRTSLTATLNEAAGDKRFRRPTRITLPRPPHLRKESRTPM